MPHSVPNDNQPEKKFVVTTQLAAASNLKTCSEPPVETPAGPKTETSNHVMLERWTKETSRNNLPVSEVMQQSFSA